MKWGHKAIAITDHGDVQAFPDANHAVPSDSDFKIIYGVEAYLVDDLKDIIVDSKGQSLNDSYVVFDLETTGLSPDKNKIIEIGASRWWTELSRSVFRPSSIRRCRSRIILSN